MKRLSLVAWLLAACTAAAANPAAVDTLTLTGQADNLSSGGSGAAGALDWTRSNPDASVFGAGVAFHSLAGSRWRLARASAAIRPAERITLTGQASLGTGRDGTRQFAYRIAGAGIGYRAADWLHLEFDDRYFDVDTTRGHLLKAGITWLPAAGWSLQGASARSAGGNLDTRFASLRLDRTLPALRLFGGFASGHSRPRVFNVGLDTATAAGSALKQGFVGIALPVARAELTLVADLLDLDAVRRRTITVALKYPLPGR